MNRPLDTTESIFHAYNELGAMITVQAVHLEGPLDESLLRTALARAQALHPALRSAIEGRSGTARFVFTEAPVELRIIDADDPEAWRGAMEGALNQGPFLPGGLPWEVRWVRSPSSSHVLIIRIAHSIADGRSLLLLTEELLQWLASAASGTPGEERPVEGAGPPLDERLAPPSLLARARHKWNRVKERVAPDASAAVPIEQPGSLSERRTRILCDRLPAASWSRLHQKARSEGTTLNGAATAAALQAVSAIIHPAEPFTLSTSVNLRKHCAPPLSDRHFGCVVASVDTRHRISGRPFWTLARETTEAIRTQVAKAPWRIRLAASRGKAKVLARSLRTAAEDPVRMGRIDVLGLSNRGVFKATRAGPFTVRAIDSGAAAHSVGSSYLVSLNATDEALSVTLCYVEPLSSRKTARRLLETLTASLRAAAGASPS